MGVDLLALSAHQFGGPMGAGALWVRPGVRLRPLIEGGTQESGLRAGTENVAAIAGMGAAAAAARRDLDAQATRLAVLAARLREGIARALPGTRTSTPERGAVPGFLHVSFRGLDGEALVALLDAEGVAASTGSACATGAGKPSHVLLAMGVPEEEARGSLRLTLGPRNTAEEVDRAVAIVRDCVSRLRGISSPLDATI
jgi:cysteine desulfurase